ncbi:DEAD/DEAH box helicase [Corynebacterium anserum]|uniref:DEAD/DEAH box helicase n=1 Tax=Corynebacterium anserum TaxID=2684406 RepID=A0A7G7YQZ9_9CORY|nr:DEAD/DEAH box helicase [Corynebacterium anserum]MBC2681522.1 DEAD/DEAH box helicase [Corynebacterium anserum]QNH96919.1 DEAD/DEAH box helicase [Corynebacterium anserum]
MTFADLGLPLPLTQALNAEGFLHPFPIQALAIPHALSGRDVLGRGPTGSGKTFTFGLPIISALMKGFSRPKAPRSVILVPTRELAVQVRSRLEPFAAAAGQRILEVVGGVKISHNIRSLARPVDILVATPGRAQDLVRQRLITLDDVCVVTLDEADQMADMGFLPQVTSLLKRMPQDTQYLLFSATLDGDVKILVDRFMHNPVEHATTPAKANLDTTTHYLVAVSDGADRRNLVVALAQNSTRAIMFVRTKYAVDRLTHTLLKAGVAAVGLHGNKGQFSRTSALEDFVSGTACVLVATDIAARGIDISDVELVVHIDIPAEHKAYIHRAGRTARAGSAGTVVTLAFDDAVEDALTLLEKAGVKPLQLSSEQLLEKIALKKGRR